MDTHPTARKKCEGFRTSDGPPTPGVQKTRGVGTVEVFLRLTLAIFFAGAPESHPRALATSIRFFFRSKGWWSRWGTRLDKDGGFIRLAVGNKDEEKGVMVWD